MEYNDSGRRVGVAGKTDEAIIADMIVSQLRFATRPLNEFWVVRLGRLDQLNGPGAYLYPTAASAELSAAVSIAEAAARGIDRTVTIDYPQEMAA